MRPGTHLQLTWTESSPKTSPTSGQTKRTALSAHSALDTRPYSTRSYSFAFSPPEGEISGEQKWQQSRGLHSGNKLLLPSWAVIRVGGKFGPEQPYPDYFPTAANKENEAAAFVFRDVKKKKTKKTPCNLGCQPQLLANAYMRSQNTFTCLPTTLPR